MATSTLGEGNSGSVTINAADSVNLSGVNKQGFAGGIYSEVATGKPGDGGNINITARSLSVSDGALLASRTNGNGNSGSININATDFVLFDGVGSNNRSAAYSLVDLKGTGRANDININTGSLFVRNGAELRAGTDGVGNGGKIKITARDTVSIDGASGYGPSRIESKVGENAVGNGGDIDIITRSLLVTNGAEVSSSSEGNGAAGNLTVNANLIGLDNRGKISAETSAGQGNINLNPRDLLILRRNSEITTKASGSNVTGGNIKIDGKNAFVIAVKNENSNIRADSDNFRGGNVTINVASIFGFQSQTTSFPNISSITARGPSPDLGGNIQINTPDTDPSRGLIELPTNLADASNQISNACTPGSPQFKNTFVATGRGGLPISPTEPLQENNTLSAWVKLTPTLSEPVTKIEPDVSIPKVAAPTIIEASGWIVDKSGNIELVSKSQFNPHSPRQTSISCAVSR